MDTENLLFLLAGAMVLDALLGEPDWLWRRLPHPVVLGGRAITWLDRRLNRMDDSSGEGPVSWPSSCWCLARACSAP